jgi:chemotaxis protein MotB
MARKPKAEKDRSERWILTYADVMNLLLVLFIILYSLGQTNTAKAQAVAVAIQQAFNESPSKIAALQAYWNSSNKSNNSSNSNTSSDTAYSDFYDKLMKLIRDNGLQNRVTIKADNRGVVISLNDNVLFASGSAELNTEAKSLVIDIGHIIKRVSYSQMLIEGNTDTDPMHTALYKDNLDLSSARANNVSRIFQYDCGIDPSTMSSLGNGEYKPVAPNDTLANKAKNRRVVITILRQTLDANAVIAAEKFISSLNTENASKSSSNMGNTSTSKISTSSSNKNGTS